MGQHEAMTDERLAEIEKAQSYGLDAEQQNELIDEVKRLRASHERPIDALAEEARRLAAEAPSAEDFEAMTRAVLLARPGMPEQ